MARVYTSEHAPAGRAGRLPSSASTPTPTSAGRSTPRAVLAFSVGQRARSCTCCSGSRPHLPLLARASPGVDPDQAFNTAASFVTNTNWQSYSGESTMGHLVQMAGLAVQNFVSAAVGMAVAVALVRGFARSRTDRLGNFWVDLVRGVVRILLPLAVVGGVVLVALRRDPEPRRRPRRRPPWPAARRPSPAARSPRRRPSRSSAPTAAASSTPTPRTRSRTRTRCRNLLEIFLLLLIPFALTRTFGRMVGDKRQGYAILAAMASLWASCSSPASDDAARSPTPARRSQARRRVRWRARRPASAVGLGAVRGLDDRHVDRRGQLVPRLVHRPRRRAADLQHGARRDRARRRRLRPLRHAGAGDHRRSSSPG